jgi:predicted RND superfamily exporter protein
MRPFGLALVALAACAASGPWIATAALGVLGADSTTPLDWVPAGHPQRQDYDRFVAAFESGDVVILSWPGCDLDAPAVTSLLEAATGDDAPRDGSGRPLFTGVACGPAAVESLMVPPLSLDRRTAVERLAGVLVGDDGRTTCLVFGISAEGMQSRRDAVDWIRSTAATAAAVAPDAVHLAGPVSDTVAVDEASFGSLAGLALPAAIVTLLVAWLAVGSLGYALLVFALAAWSVGLAFTTLAVSGDRMSAVLIVMPVLVLVLGVSGGIHLLNYLGEALATGGRRGVAARGVRLAWLPCGLSAGTTAIGLVSLAVSELEPIRTFGVHAAIGVLAGPAAMFLVLPGLFERWPIPPRLALGWAAAARQAAGFVIRRARPVAWGFLALAVVAAAGLPRLRTSVRIDTLFTPQSRVIQDYEWIEDKIGPLVPIEVVLRFAADSDLRPAARLGMVREVEARLAGLAGVSAASSAAGLLPDLPARGAIGAALAEAKAARRLAAADVGYVRDVAGEQWWRVTARIPALADVDYGEFLDRVRAAVEPVAIEAGGEERGVAIACTGTMPLVHAIQNTLLRDLAGSFLTACGVIAVVMMLVEGGIGPGLVAMTSNLFPSVLLFGLLGWARVPLDIGSVMTASIALGMAIDGTLHFLTFYGRARAAGASAAAAVRDAYGHAAAALVQTTLVCGLGLLVFTLSSFAPTSRFAWMLTGLLVAALLGDLLLLPALLLGPAGGWFRPARDAGPRPPPACGLPAPACGADSGRAP